MWQPGKVAIGNPSSASGKKAKDNFYKIMAKSMNISHFPEKYATACNCLKDLRLSEQYFLDSLFRQDMSGCFASFVQNEINNSSDIIEK